jgi:GT2 family glycosyltransferase
MYNHCIKNLIGILIFLYDYTKDESKEKQVIENYTAYIRFAKERCMGRLDCLRRSRVLRVLRKFARSFGYFQALRGNALRCKQGSFGKVS